MQKRAVLSGRLSFVHAVYPILKVHSTDFFSNIFFLSKAAYAWGRNSSVRSLRSRDLACLDYQNNSQHIHTAPCGATSALADAFYVHYSRMLFGYSLKNTPSFRKGLGVGYICRFLRFLFSLFSLIPCPLPPRDEREKTERTTAQLPANKKCCLLIFAIAIGCLVLADFPASSLPVTLVHPVLPFPFLSTVMLSRFHPREIPPSTIKNRPKSDFYLLFSKNYCTFAPQRYND